MSTKHTPGPWFAGHMPGWSGICILRRPAHEYGPSGTIGDAPIAQVIDKAPHWDNAYPVEANASVIGAAPDLLVEIEREYIELADYRNDWPGRNSFSGQTKLCRLRALISKATGRSEQEVQDDYGTRAARGEA